MFIVWQLIIPILLILAVIRWLAKTKEQKARLDIPVRRRNTQGFKCAFCLYCKRMDEDGVLCSVGKTPTFKTPVHINNCIDFTRDS
ncbi:hypothetical protein [Candidatus Uabimicrobium amorphum]|uniref:Uncharacterized protein n=1 Tax=Uabimicrobium amorphum TaxID=2596890 RepID=A0A5S9F5L9_UABAM|nr:hypothetical protein [Candidatus Uabimicrobium amorphum]BBM86762.1 hypothetical protein UABAM_05149 [Candidatus Uabimicrobium amorphum]